MIKLSSVQRVLPFSILLIILIAGQGPQQAECFWLTDGISLQTADFIGPSPRPQTETSTINPAASIDNAPSSSRVAVEVEKTSKQKATLEAKQEEPWIAGHPSSQAAQQQQQQQQSSPKNENNSIQFEGNLGLLQQQQQRASCQCNPDWLQNQTNLWLNKWLSSPNFTNQLKTYANGLMMMMSNSTGATNHHGNNNTNNLRRDAKQQRHNSTSNNHLSAWIRAKGSSTNNSNSNNNKNNNNNSNNNNNNNNEARGNHDASTRSSMASKGNGGGKWERSSGQHQHNAAVGTTKFIPGERGPKGDQGPRGERGPSGLISVKDRDALFDLSSASASSASNTSGANHNNDSNLAKQQQLDGVQTQQQRARLVFVESEQMLVVDTASGWRPVQMLAPLRDFRKTVAKYNLNNPDDRRRLLILNAQNAIVADNSIGQLGHRMRSLSPNDDDDPTVMANFNSLTNMKSRGSTAISGDDDPIIGDLDAAADDDDDDDDDTDDEEESNDVADDEKNDTGEDDDDDDDEEDDDDDDAGGSDVNDLIIANDGDDDSGRSINSLSPTGRRRLMPDKLANSQGSKFAGDGKRRHLQVASRSGLSSPMQINSPGNLPMTGTKEQTRGSSAPTTNKWAKVSINDHDDHDDENEDSDNENTMKLRLIALNEPYSGNVHGLRGANFECRRHATKANIKGAFGAFLATNYQNLNEVMRYNAAQKYPIVNLRGEVLANSWHDLFKQPARMPNPLSRIYSFDGRHVATDSNWPNKLVWHGSGSKLGSRDSAHNCDGWHSDSLNKFGYASPLHSPRTHLGSSMTNKRQQHKRNHHKRYLAEATVSTHNQSSTVAEAQPVLDAIEKYPCRMPLIVLCIETIAQAD